MVITTILSLVTSQNVTAPKLCVGWVYRITCLVTSQNVTAPKLEKQLKDSQEGLVTSQNVTAPKRLCQTARRSPA